MNFANCPRTVTSSSSMLLLLLVLVVLCTDAVMLPVEPAGVLSVRNITSSACSASQAECGRSLSEEECMAKNVCKLQCNGRDDFPSRQNPMTDSLRQQCLSKPGKPNEIPDLNASSEVWMINSSHPCIINNTTSTQSGRLSLSLWMKVFSRNCTLVHVEGVATLEVKESLLCLDGQCDRTSVIGNWSHVVLQVINEGAYAIVNGNFDNQNVFKQTANPATQRKTFNVTIGNVAGSDAHYEIYDVRLFNDTLTEREVKMLYTGVLTPAGLLPACRCPSAYPRLKQSNNYTCVNSSNSELKRLQVTYNGPDVLIDENFKTNWLIPPDNITLQVELMYDYQVETILINFLNGTPPQLPGDNTMTCNTSSCLINSDCLPNMVCLGSETVLSVLRTSVIQARTLSWTPPETMKNLVLKDLILRGRCNSGYFNIEPPNSSVNCVPCNCTKYGALNLSCESNGQCYGRPNMQGLKCSECKNGTEKLQLQDCEEHVNSMKPSYGPQAGGTKVTIRGYLLGSSNQSVHIFLDSVKQTEIMHNDTMIIFETSASSTTGSRFLQISWGVPYCPFPSNLSFIYHLNPVLSSLPNVSMHVSGGCGLQLRGSNLDRVAVSRLFVTNSVSNKSVSALCRSVTQELFCFTPNLTQNLGSPNDRFYYMVELDETFYPNQSLVTVLVDPVVDNIGDVKFSPQFEKQISITGSHLTGGCSKEEITVLVGVIRCKITSLSENKLTCTPPSSPLDGFSKFPVKVQIGNYRQTVGNLIYLKFWETTYFIGIMCGIGAFIILVIVVAVIISCYRHRKSQQGFAQSLPKDSERIVTASDNHYTQLHIINSGFEDPIQSVNIAREPKLTIPPNLTETELMKEFLQRIDPSLMESVKASIISGSQLVSGKTWVNTGKYAQIIDGTFAMTNSSPTNKVLIKTLKEPLPDQGAFPVWVNAALRKCLRFYHYNHEHVLSTTGIVLDEKKFHIVYPFMEICSLKNHISNPQKEFSLRQLLEFGVQVAEGLSFLTDKDITHRDLAARNCMVDATNTVKITDAVFSWDCYGEEYTFDSSRDRFLPIRWMAPESLMDGYYDRHSDVWSCGVVLWELLTRGCLPYHEASDSQLKGYVIHGYFLGKPINCPDKVYDLMRQCWNVESSERPSISKVVMVLSEELTGEVHSEDIYMNMVMVEGMYENQQSLDKVKRRAPLPP